jgi:FtsH-binding integral membrane protein
MEIRQQPRQTISTPSAQGISMASTFISNVFLWMFLALGITALTAYLFANDATLLGYLVNYETGSISTLGWVVMFAPLGFVLLMSFGYQKFSSVTLTLLFLTFAVLVGMSLSFILLAYTGASVFKTFIVTSGMFGIMAVTGYTTKMDLTRFGSLMFMGLIGIIIASLLNMFMRSETMDYVISFIGVLVFTGLTAYDVQKLKRIGSGVQYGAESTRKLVILGALNLYLDFINLFLFLLRFLGVKK